MITGTVHNGLEARIRLSVRGASGHETEIEAVIDTGYDGFLTLPPEIIESLGCPALGVGEATLADGRTEEFRIYEATVLWDGLPRILEVDESPAMTLLGMGLLQGYELQMQVVPGGSVTIEAIP